MLVVTNRIFVNPDHVAVFEHTFLTRSGLVDNMPGFLFNQVLRPVNAGDPYVILTAWQSRQEFETWVKSPEFLQGHARSGTLPAETYSQPSKLEIFDVINDSSRPDLVPEPAGKPFRFH